MANKAEAIIDTILEKLQSFARTETVIGNPVEVGNTTILPVIKVSIGFGAGGGEGTIEDGKENKTPSGGGGGGAGGGGVSIVPVGFIVVDDKGVRFLGMGKGKYDALFETVPDLLAKFGITKKEGKGKGKGDKDKQEGKDKGSED